MYHLTAKVIPMKALVLLTAALAVSSCSRSHGKALEQANAPTSARVDSPDVFRFKVGALDAIALKDGDIHVPNDGKTVGVGRPSEAVAALLAPAGLSIDTIDFSIQPLLVRDGARTFLFDAGAATAPFARAGRLPESLRAAAIAPSQITDIFISHAHPDHVGGLVTASGTLAFPNARIHISAPEWEAMQANAEQRELVAVIAPRVAAFSPDAAILPNVTAVAIRGHTPGHSAYRITSGREQLLVIGDAAHHSVVSVERPDWVISFDVDGGDATTAQVSRRALLQRAADERLRLYAGHFPFPGVGHVRRRGDGFVWAPETSADSGLDGSR
jgi:glyoxylase-like metal-dependent hydrolase (beta-lactamase superfamily II)